MSALVADELRRRRERLLERRHKLARFRDPELMMRRSERASTLLTSNRPVDDWGKLLGDTAAVTASLDRLLHMRTSASVNPELATKLQTGLQQEEGVR